MTYRRIIPDLTSKQARTFRGPSLYRACVNGYLHQDDKWQAEYDECQKHIEIEWELKNYGFKRPEFSPREEMANMRKARKELV